MTHADIVTFPVMLRELPEPRAMYWLDAEVKEAAPSICPFTVAAVFVVALFALLVESVAFNKLLIPGKCHTPI